MDPCTAQYLEAPHDADILIVDDTLENLVFLADVLESQGYLVRKARSGEMALRAVTAAQPDLILLDICMPDMDGYELCRRLKRNSATASVPVIFLSALGDAVDKVKAFDLGGVDYITKPFQAAEVLARTRNQLLLKAAAAAVHRLNQQLEMKVQQRTAQLEAANAQLMDMAYHDDLTGLPNRTQLTQGLAKAIAQMQTDPDYQFALLFLDCDRFKLVNDSFGHAAGDALLVDIAQRLAPCLQSEDTLARFGGDEFVILLHQAADAKAAQAIAQALLDALASRFSLPQGDIFITASIGVVMSNPTQHYRTEHMLRDADTAMYCAKTAGKARYSLFDPSMQQASADLLKIETDLHRALQQGELVPYYQPIVDLATQKIVGMEALCRWQHPERGLLLPHTFIPAAEETHLIVEVGKELLEQVCAQLQDWQQRGCVSEDFYISVNLATRHLCQPNLPTDMGKMLKRYDLTSQHIHLEITESSVLDNKLASKIMKQLEFQKIRLSVDDFGTGYSSLSYLHNLPVSILKIDRTFVKDICHSVRDREVVMAIVGIAQALNLDIIAEGIETEAQMAFLCDMGCRWGQGYLFSRPQCSLQIESLLASSETVQQAAMLKAL
jgi:diguanylate cyclase (GGDEF)-like protein